MKGFFTGLVVATVLSVTISQKAQARCNVSYIPPHSTEELQAVQEWAIGGAFAVFSRYTNYKWDHKTYAQDIPNQALFNFGRATATSCLSMDVLQLYVGAFHHLAVQLNKARQSDNKMKAFVGYSQMFLEVAEAYGMDQYLIPRGEML